MTTPPKTPADLPPHKAARMERLEEQLRANLKRRKDAARARAAPADGPPEEPAPAPEKRDR